MVSSLWSGDFGEREGHVLYQRRGGEVLRVPVDWDPATLAAQAATRPIRTPGSGHRDVRT
jgi:hypothetical protein